MACDVSRVLRHTFSEPTERYRIVDAMENAFKAGYKWEVVDTETDNVMCAAPTHELAELMARPVRRISAKSCATCS
jgi:hypothetical protein